MRKVIVYIAMSLDGYIASEKGSVDWLGGDGSDTDNMGSYPEFIETIDTVILGYSTYHQIVTELSPDNWVYSGMKSYVFTSKEVEDTEEIFFKNGKIADLVKKLKNEDGKNIWICGGSTIVNQLIEEDLVDKYCISIVPTILGGGVKLFDKHENETKLKLISTRNYNGMVDVWYEKRR